MQGQNVGFQQASDRPMVQSPNGGPTTLAGPYAANPETFTGTRQPGMAASLTPATPTAADGTAGPGSVTLPAVQTPTGLGVEGGGSPGQQLAGDPASTGKVIYASNKTRVLRDNQAKCRHDGLDAGDEAAWKKRG